MWVFGEKDKERKRETKKTFFFWYTDNGCLSSFITQYQQSFHFYQHQSRIVPFFTELFSSVSICSIHEEFYRFELSDWLAAQMFVTKDKMKNKEKKINVCSPLKERWGENALKVSFYLFVSLDFDFFVRFCYFFFLHFHFSDMIHPPAIGRLIWYRSALSLL